MISVSLTIIYYKIYLRSTSPWTEVEERYCQPWEQRTFPLTEDELKDMEVSGGIVMILR